MSNTLISLTEVIWLRLRFLQLNKTVCQRWTDWTVSDIRERLTCQPVCPMNAFNSRRGTGRWGLGISTWTKNDPYPVNGWVNNNLDNLFYVIFFILHIDSSLSPDTMWLMSDGTTQPSSPVRLFSKHLQLLRFFELHLFFQAISWRSSCSSPSRRYKSSQTSERGAVGESEGQTSRRLVTKTMNLDLAFSPRETSSSCVCSQGVAGIYWPFEC